MDKSLEQWIDQVSERCEELVLASIDSDGFPRSVPMCKIHSSGKNEGWVRWC